MVSLIGGCSMYSTWRHCSFSGEKRYSIFLILHFHTRHHQGPIRGSVHLFSLLSSHLVLLSCLSYRLIFCGNLQLLKQRRPHWLKLSQKSLLTTTKMRPFWWFSNTVRGLLKKVDIPKVPRHRQKILCNKSLENLYFMTIGFSDIFPLTSIEMSSYPQQKTSWKLKPVIVMWNQNSLAKGGEEARTRGTFKSHITPGFSPLCSFNNPKTSGVKNFFYHTTTTFLLHLAQPSSLLKSSSMPYWPNIPCIGVCNLGFSKSFFLAASKKTFSSLTSSADFLMVVALLWTPLLSGRSTLHIYTHVLSLV